MAQRLQPGDGHGDQVTLFDNVVLVVQVVRGSRVVFAEIGRSFRHRAWGARLPQRKSRIIHRYCCGHYLIETRSMLSRATSLQPHLDGKVGFRRIVSLHRAGYVLDDESGSDIIDRLFAGVLGLFPHFVGCTDQYGGGNCRILGYGDENDHCADTHFPAPVPFRPSFFHDLTDFSDDR